MKRFVDMSINRKLSTIIVLVCVGALLLTGASVIVAEFVNSRMRISEQTVVLGDLLARNTAAALAFHRPEDRDEITRTLSALAADVHVEAACVYDSASNIFGQYTRRGAPEYFPSVPFKDGSRMSRITVEMTGPVELDRQRLGTIYVREDLGRMYHRIELHAMIVVSILLLSVILIIALTPRIRRPITEPLLELADLARRVATEKDYSTRAQKRGNDEIGVLTGAFNHMLQEIEAGQASLRAARDSAEAANRAKDQFLAMLSHELRTPLTPVLLTVSLLETRQGLPQEVHEDLLTIRRHVELEARLIDDLLDLTRIARGKISLNLHAVDVHRLLSDAVAICAGDRPQETSMQLQAQDHVVRADSGRLLQVFWNLLSNARKFTPKGGNIIVRSSNPAPGKILVEVIDTGVGIEPDVLPRLFTAFEQGEKSFTRRFGGLGLGLTIAKALVELHGGTITASSPGKDQGATFTVELQTISQGH